MYCIYTSHFANTINIHYVIFCCIGILCNYVIFCCIGVLCNEEGVPEDEENFDEAIKSVNTALVPTKVRFNFRVFGPNGLFSCQMGHLLSVSFV